MLNSILKQKLVSPEVLLHYNPMLTLKLACDAFTYRVGVVFPIHYAVVRKGQLFMPQEVSYRVIRTTNEALGLVFGLQKFHQFLY